MASKIIKNIIAILWITIVIFYYFGNHAYFGESWAFFGSWFLYIAIIPLIYTCYSLYQFFQKDQAKIKIKITFLRVLATAILMILLAGNTAFIVKSPSHYIGQNLFYTEDETGVSLSVIDDLSTLTENDTLIVNQNGVMEWTKDYFDSWIPESLRQYFIMPTFWQIQWGLLSKTIGILAILGLITLTAISFGLTILKKLLKTDETDAETTLIGLGLGLFGITLLTFILGAFHVLTMPVAWIMFAIVLGISWKALFQTIKKLFKFEYTFESKILSFDLLIILILALTISVNFIDNISPLPRGWDGMNQYINIPQRISEAQGLILTGVNYYWELMISLGLVMFNWVTISLNLASFFPATITLFALYIVFRKFLSKTTSLIVLASIYLTPMYLFHGVEENKIDMANFAISIIAFLSLYKGLESESKREKLSFIAVAGLLLGFCFGMKITGLILILAFLTIILHKEFKKTGLVAGILSSIGVIASRIGINLGSEAVLPVEKIKIAGLILIIIAICLILIKLIKQKSWASLKTPLVLVICTILAFSPWMIKNGIENRGSETRSGITALINGARPQPTIDYEMLEEDYGLDASLCTSTGTYEELDRYIGYSSIIENYITMPWHLTMNDLGTQGIYIDFGWIFLAFIPGLFLFIPFRKINRKWVLIASFAIIYWILWAITCNGIIWYGLPGFLALGLVTGGLIDNYQKLSKDHEIVIKIIVTIFLISSLVFRLSSVGKGTLLLYTAGVLDEESAITSIFPYALTIHDIFEEDQDGQYDLIWKIGTNLSYFVEDNYWRMHDDQYIDVFNCLYQERDPQLLTERLKALGYGYIIFDYYTYTLSPDPNGTLWEKYSAAWDYILNYTDMIVPDYFRGHIVAKIL